MILKKILVPVDLASISSGVVHQAALLARHFSSEIVLLHVVTPFSYPAGLFEKGHQLTDRDMHSEIIKQAEKDLEQSLRPELDGIAVKRLLLRGEPAREILQAARAEGVDMIAMASDGIGPIYRLLLGSVTAKVLHDCDCPMWVTPRLDPEQPRDFAIRNILCAVDLDHHSRDTITEAAQMAAAFGGKLTLAHVTAGVEIYGPGGPHVDPAFKKEVFDYATQEIAKLQSEAGTNAEVIIESGNVHKMLNQIAKQTNADLLIIGRMPSGGHLGANSTGHAIIRESHIPVLSA
jgi:nucleotide-binding universal stress UspA family protein